MQVNDFKNITQSIKYEILKDEKEYLKLLKVKWKIEVGF